MSTHTLKATTTRDGRVPTGKSKNGRAVRSNEDLVAYWRDSLLEREPRPYLSPDGISIIVDGDKIYSYGKHFTIAKIVRRKSGVPFRVLMNADTWSGGGWTSTADHQGYVRSAVDKVKDELSLEVLEIPFSAVEAAGIHLDSLTPVEIRPSRRTYHNMSSATAPGAFVKIYDEQRQPTGEVDTTQSSVERPGMQHAWSTGPAVLQPDGTWTWTVERHWMGDSLVRGKSTEHRFRKLTKDEREAWEHYVWISKETDAARDAYHASYTLYGDERPGGSYDEILGQQFKDLNLYRVECQERTPYGISHAGRGAKEPRVRFSVTRWALYLSSFDYNEPHRPYFLCELPYGCKATTVDEGIEALMPSEVRTAVAVHGDGVKRQGDIFAIPTGLSTDALESMAIGTKVKREGEPLDHHPWREYHEATVTMRRPRANETYESGELDIYGTNHRAAHMLKVRHADGKVYWYGRGTLYHAPANRDPDHRTIKLSKVNDDRGWFRFVKNTVPTTNTRNGGRQSAGSSIFQSGQSRAWTVGGGVD